jgi:hypothetical protein
MSPASTLWLDWAEMLRRYRMDGFAIWLLEAGAPIAPLAAQLLYIGQPFVPSQSATQHIYFLANMLEDREETHTFVEYLRNPTP